nr:condensation domain-containing protein [Bacillus subtilis]
MTLLTKIHKETGIEIPLQFLFEHPTIAALAEEADHRESREFSVIEPAEKQEHYPLSLAQQRTYIVSQFEDAGVGYNMPAAAILEEPLDIQKLERAFQGLIRRHESLRTSFVLENSTPRQKIHNSVDFNIEMIERGGTAQMRQLWLHSFGNLIWRKLRCSESVCWGLKRTVICCCLTCTI